MSTVAKRLSIFAKGRLVLVQRLDAHEYLLEQALEKGADVAAHADGLGLVVVVNLLAHVGELVDELAQLLVRRLGPLLPGRHLAGRRRAVRLLQPDLPPLERLLERREDDVVERVELAVGARRRRRRERRRCRDLEGLRLGGEARRLGGEGRRPERRRLGQEKRLPAAGLAGYPVKGLQLRRGVRRHAATAERGNLGQADVAKLRGRP
ncbi:hypothetical protein VDGD_20906 [Verticillium dahliae]|nr:hypothetical protein VDGD_20906 [Verticillium dahliae]